MIIHLETSIHRFLYKLVLLNYFRKQDLDKILYTLKKQEIELTNLTYDINKLLKKYHEWIQAVNEKSLYHLCKIRKNSFSENEIMAVFIIEKYCHDNSPHDSERSKAIQVAFTLAIDLCSPLFLKQKRMTIRNQPGTY